jgi:hypothetical protein
MSWSDQVLVLGSDADAVGVRFPVGRAAKFLSAERLRDAAEESV